MYNLLKKAYFYILVVENYILSAKILKTKFQDKVFNVISTSKLFFSYCKEIFISAFITKSVFSE